MPKKKKKKVVSNWNSPSRRDIIRSHTAMITVSWELSSRYRGQWKCRFRSKLLFITTENTLQICMLFPPRGAVHRPCVSSGFALVLMREAPRDWDHDHDFKTCCGALRTGRQSLFVRRSRSSRIQHYLYLGGRRTETHRWETPRCPICTQTTVCLPGQGEFPRW